MSDELDLSFVQIAEPKEDAGVKQTDVLDMSFLDPPRTVMGAAGTRRQLLAESQDTDRETRATRELPEITNSGLLSNASLKDVAKVAPAILTATDPNEIADILSKNFRFIGITEDEKGNLIANNNETGVQAVINKPGMSPLDVLQMLGIGSSFVPSAAVAGAVKPLAGKIATAMTGAGATQAVTEAGQQAVGGTFDKSEVFLAAGTAGTAEVVLPAIQGLRGSALRREATEAGQLMEDVAENVRVAEEASEATGVDLFQGQKTLIPTQLDDQAFIAQLPAGTAKARRELTKQNKQASEAVDTFLEMIGPDESVVTGPTRFRTAAQAAVEATERARVEATSPIYKQAARRQRQGHTPLIDTSKLEKKIFEMSNQFDPKGQIHINLSKALSKIQNAKGDLQKLHLAKIEIDQIVDAFGADSVGKTTKRFLTGIKKDLVDDLVNQSPSYRAARDEFIRLSPGVNKMQNSILGKLHNIDDGQLKNISKRLFDPAETNPKVIANAKKIINDIDPDSWNEILRSELERRMGSIRSTLESGSTENIPNQLFKAIFGNDKQKKVLYAALTPDGKRNLRHIETVLNRARLGRTGGSQTASRQERMKELRGGWANMLRNFFTAFRTPIGSAGNIASAAITGATADASFNNRVRALADVMFDPRWEPRMKDLRQLPTHSPAEARAMAQLLDDAYSGIVENFLPFDTDTEEE